ncbi:MAG: hypothetical protein K2R98_28660 [Gemmataceae bacterium]|nr:hypothetical protein [Gemmataceae bacterium]
MRTALAIVFALTVTSSVHAQDKELMDLLRGLDARVIVRGQVRQPPMASMLSRDAEAGLRLANRADQKAWEEVKTRSDWERFRDRRLQALRGSLGQFPPVPKDLKLRVTGSLDGDGYRVDRLVFQTRPGSVVTANLYRPAKLAASMPGIVIALSHQRPKHDGQRQDMAMTWARAGCLVLVPDHLGHGERRQHTFGEDGPHDYHMRYDTGIQLHLIGESLMGWLAWDLMRGVDVLLAEKGVDSKRLLLISEPAGGGDVAAVTAALDPRITGVMIQNFGGPQPETAYPLAKDAEHSYAYAGCGSWESTRNLRLSARDGFLPWAIVASVAPRRLIYFHEFYWDREQDPVWKRLQRVYGLYDAADSLTGIAGQGFVVGSAPENSHWLPINRELLYPVLDRWFGIANPKKEYSNRRPVADLLCLTPEATKELQPQPLHVLATSLGAERLAMARKELATLTAAQRQNRLRRDWSRLLGDVAPTADPVVRQLAPERESLGKVTAERIHLATEPGIVVPVLLLSPAVKEKRVPVVVAIAPEGKQEFLRQRAGPISELLAAGTAVCLLDVRGTGETSPGEGRGRGSSITSISASELMRGQSLLGGRLRDLRAVLRHLRQRPELDARRLALWGDSFAPVNPADRELKVPHNAAQRPAQSEPLGGLLALLGALFEEDVCAVYVRGGLSDYHSALAGPFCYLPHDTVVPEVLTIGDLPDLAGTLAPRPLRLEGLVDGLNRKVPSDGLRTKYEPAQTAYEQAKAAERLRVGDGEDKEPSVARWFVGHLAETRGEAPMAEGWDYAPAMKKVAAKFRGQEGVVLHVGGSMTIANPYGTWPRSGKGKTPADEAILKWMHTEAKDKTDGWWLCRTEVEHYRAYTSESGLQAAMLLKGGKRGLPTLEKMLTEYRPRMVTLEVGIYDVEENVPLDDYRRDIAKALDLILDQGAIPVLNTIPPFKAQLERTKQFNEALRALAKERAIPVIDLEREILTRRPDDWFGPLMNRIHLTAGNTGAEPTAENLRRSGYLLRGWLTVQKVAEIKRRVLD